jgi:MerR family redox-sensitive transcriptional activator SoxR
MDGMTIGEVARRSDVRPSALRYYESAGILPAPERVNGRRRYEGGVLEVLAVVRFARRAGFSIAEIRTFLHGFPEGTPPSERWRWLAHQKLPEIEALIERALGTKRLLERGLTCECAWVEDCVACG